MFDILVTDGDLHSVQKKRKVRRTKPIAEDTPVINSGPLQEEVEEHPPEVIAEFHQWMNKEGLDIIVGDIYEVTFSDMTVCVKNIQIHATGDRLTGDKASCKLVISDILDPDITIELPLDRLIKAKAGSKAPASTWYKELREKVYIKFILYCISKYM
jgi:hypothetical protein